MQIGLNSLRDELLSDLLQLYAFLRARTFIVGDRDSIMWMVKHMQNPPLTMRRNVAMQLTRGEYYDLGQLLERIEKMLTPAQDESPVGIEVAESDA